jgi:HME family heavy-metal exporter
VVPDAFSRWVFAPSAIYALVLAGVLAFALTPLLLAADAPGKEILHPVAVVIFGGLVSSTLLDTLLTPLMYLKFGRQATERMLAQDAGPAASPKATDAY